MIEYYAVLCSTMQISITLKRRIGLLKRIRQRVPLKKLTLIAEAIFNSVLRYGISLYLNPVFEKEDLKRKSLSENATKLQTLQNDMLRGIHGVSRMSRMNMQKTRENLKMMSVNQLCIYHTILEAYNVIKTSSSEKIKKKWSNISECNCLLRSVAKGDQKIPKKPKEKCLGFTYYGSKLFNMLPCNIRDTKNPNTFKSMIKDWIWKNIPSY